MCCIRCRPPVFYPPLCLANLAGGLSDALLLCSPLADLFRNLLLGGQVVEGPARALDIDPCALEEVLLVLTGDGQVEDALVGHVLKEVLRKSLERQGMWSVPRET